MNQKLTLELLLNAYANGYFPMADDRESDEVSWYYPEKRGIIPLDEFHVPASLAKQMRKNPFIITADKVFPDVIRACGEDAPDRPETWINNTIIHLYCELWEKGFGHSIECWQGDTLVGGLYGVALGGAFFGESMFSRASGASKIALVELVSRLKGAGYQLLDTQYVNDHLTQFGVREVPRDDYLKLLREALPLKPTDCWTP